MWLYGDERTVKPLPALHATAHLIQSRQCKSSARRREKFSADLCTLGRGRLLRVITRQLPYLFSLQALVRGLVEEVESDIKRCMFQAEVKDPDWLRFPP